MVHAVGARSVVAVGVALSLAACASVQVDAIASRFKYRVPFEVGQTEATNGDRTRILRYFLRSKIRAILRWFKYVFTFDDWLDYIARKAARRTGLRIELTPLERKLPLLLLWPKVIRVLRQRSSPPEPPPTRPGERPTRTGTVR